MKKLLFISSALCMLIFTNCKKKEDPAPVNITVPGGGTAQGPPGSTKSGSLTSANKTQTFDVLVIDSPSNYTLSGTTTKGAYSSLRAEFLNGKPTAGETIDFSSEQDVLSLGIGDSSANYYAISGTAVVTVNNNKVSVTFSGVTFISTDLNTAVVGSGSISSSL